MQVILLENIVNLGSLGDSVNVKPGYARNYLIPYQKAVPATKDNLAHFEQRRAELEQKAAELLAGAQARAEKIQTAAISIAAKVGEEGKLFGSIGTRDIAEAITAAGIEVAKKEVSLPEGVIRIAGDYEINIQLHSEVTATAKVAIVAED